MVGISSRLLRSIVIITILHLSLGAIFYYSLTPTQYTAWLNFLGRNTDPSYTSDLATLNSLLISDFKSSFTSWWPYFLLALFLTLVVLFSFVLILKIKRKNKEVEKDSYKGIGVSIGKLYKPKKLKISNKKFQFPDEITAKYQPLLTEILNYQVKNKLDFKETLNKINLALELESTCNFILAVAAIRLDTAPTRAFTILGNLKQWTILNEIDRQIIAYSVNFHLTPKQLPLKIPYLADQHRQEIKRLIEEIQFLSIYLGKQPKKLEYAPLHLPLIISDEKTENGTQAETKRNLFSKANENLAKSTAPEKQEVHELKNIVGLEEQLQKAFIDAIKKGHFQSYGQRKNLRSIGWRKGKYLFLLQNVLNDALIKNMKNKKLMQEIENMFESDEHIYTYSNAAVAMPGIRSWLVTQFDTIKGQRTAREDYPMWVIQTGENKFVGVLIFELPEELQYFYPQETKYQLEVVDAYKVKTKNELFQSEFEDFF